MCHFTQNLASPCSGVVTDVSFHSELCIASSELPMTLSSFCGALMDVSFHSEVCITSNGLLMALCSRGVEEELE